jgi:cytochrome b561
MTYYYTLLLIFGVITYMIVVDPNVAKYIVLLWKLAEVNIRRGIFLIKFYPRLMWDTFNIKRTIKGKKKDWANVAAEKLAQELDIPEDRD